MSSCRTFSSFVIRPIRSCTRCSAGAFALLYSRSSCAETGVTPTHGNREHITAMRTKCCMVTRRATVPTLNISLLKLTVTPNHLLRILHHFERDLANRLELLHLLDQHETPRRHLQLKMQSSCRIRSHDFLLRIPRQFSQQLRLLAIRGLRFTHSLPCRHRISMLPIQHFNLH